MQRAVWKAVAAGEERDSRKTKGKKQGDDDRGAINAHGLVPVNETRLNAILRGHPLGGPGYIASYCTKNTHDGVLPRTCTTKCEKSMCTPRWKRRAELRWYFRFVVSLEKFLHSLASSHREHVGFIEWKNPRGTKLVYSFGLLFCVEAGKGTEIGRITCGIADACSRKDINRSSWRLLFYSSEIIAGMEWVRL